MKIRVGGEWRDIIGAKIRQAGSWRTIAAVKIYSGGAWRSASDFSVEETPTSSEFAVNINPTDNLEDSAATVTSASDSIARLNANPVRGRRPFTYLWEIQSSSGTGTAGFATATKAETNVTLTGMVSGQSLTVTVKVTCTDSADRVATDTHELTFTRS